MKYIQAINPPSVRYLVDKNHYNAIQDANSLLKTPRWDISVQTNWFPTLQSPGNARYHILIQKLTLTELYALEELEKLDPQANQKSGDQLLSNFSWTDSTLILANESIHRRPTSPIQ